VGRGLWTSIFGNGLGRRVQGQIGAARGWSAGGELDRAEDHIGAHEMFRSAGRPCLRIRGSGGGSDPDEQSDGRAEGPAHERMPHQRWYAIEQ
jgi:hypothetical protein